MAGELLKTPVGPINAPHEALKAPTIPHDDRKSLPQPEVLTPAAASPGNLRKSQQWPQTLPKTSISPNLEEAPKAIATPDNGRKPQRWPEELSKLLKTPTSPSTAQQQQSDLQEVLKVPASPHSGGNSPQWPPEVDVMTKKPRKSHHILPEGELATTSSENLHKSHQWPPDQAILMRSGGNRIQRQPQPLQPPSQRYFPTQLNNREYISQPKEVWKIRFLDGWNYYRGLCADIPSYSTVVHCESSYFDSSKKSSDLEKVFIATPVYRWTNSCFSISYPNDSYLEMI
jgi:hypothetical protein